MDQLHMFRSALDVMHEAICLCDLTGAVLYMNSAAKELTGWQDGSACHEISRQILIDSGQTACGNIRLNGRLLYYSISPMPSDTQAGDTQPGGFLVTLKRRSAQKGQNTGWRSFSHKPTIDRKRFGPCPKSSTGDPGVFGGCGPGLYL
jgi:PAS domain-containing protein